MVDTIPRRRRPALTALTLAGAIAGTAALGAAPADAATVKLAGQGTTLKLEPAVGKALKSLGVKVAPTGPAKAGASGVTFPITGGAIDPATAAGTIRHSGGLRLSAGKVKVTLSDYIVRIGKQATLSSKVDGGRRARLLVPVTGKAKITRNGLGTTVSNVSLHLTGAGAAALNRTFGVKAFKAKLKLGTLTVRATPAEVAFAGGQTDLAVDPGTLSALTSLGVTPGLAGDARANPDGSFGFPITGGKVDAKTLAGSIPHSGGITLTKGGTTVALTDFLIDTRSATLAAKVNGSDPVQILSLDLASPKVTISGREVTVAGVAATLTKAAADALNAAFGTTAFTEGLRLGVATVRGQAA